MSIRLMIVDDDRDLLFLIQRFLSSEFRDFEVTSTISAQDALRWLELDEFDAIVCDYYLGPDEMNGLDLLQWVRESGIRVPFIMFTGKSQEDLAIRALNLGADFYLKKDDSELEDVLEELVHYIKSAVETKRIEAAFQSSEKKFQIIFEEAPIGIARISIDGFFLEVNNHFAELLEYDREKLLKMHLKEITGSQSDELEKRLMNELNVGLRERFQISKTLFNSDHEPILTLCNMSVVHDSRGKPVYYIALFEETDDFRVDSIAKGEKDDIGVLQRDWKERIKKERLEFSQFLREISHSVNNQLLKIRLILSILEDSFDEPEAKRIETTSEEISSYLKRAVAYADAGIITESEANIDLDDIVKSLLVPILPKSVSLDMTSLPKVSGNIEKIKGVFRNIFDILIEQNNLTQLDIKCERKKEQYQIFIESDGDALDKERRDLLSKTRFTSEGAKKDFRILIANRFSNSLNWKINYQFDPKSRFILEIPKLTI